MKTSRFNRYLLIEQIRYIESATSLDCFDESERSGNDVHGDFEQRLWQRARSLVDRCELLPALGHAETVSRWFNRLALFLAALLGASGIAFAVTDTSTINIYWLLLILLGFNLLSMLFWLTGIGMNMSSSVAGVVSTVWAAGLKRLVYRRSTNTVNIHDGSHFPDHSPDHRHNHPQTVQPSQGKASNLIRAQADRAWLTINYSGVVGKWQLSSMTHQFWLAYLSAGLITLVLMLMLRQFDFVWGTTLLSDSAFLTLTDILSMPLNALGFSTPDADQVQQTRIGATQLLTEEHRYNWAQFLLGSLLCFGLLPRLILWLWSAMMCAHARRHFSMDFYLPYYVQLRQQLMPFSGGRKIIDADESPPSRKPPATDHFRSPAKSSEGELALSSHQFLDEAFWVAVELDENIDWPLNVMNGTHTSRDHKGKDLGQITDRESLGRVLQQLKNNTDIAVAVSSARPPDRGLQRTVCQLVVNSGQRWLVLLSNDYDEVSDARMAAWYRLAEACQIPADHVIAMSTS